ncbi:MAG TPA: hypothetical protein PK257_00415 [Candidatus Woesebacteria bacterium]|nr:hypothetical protein [Candidatus Woesebacteria bacterium]
MSLEYIVYTDKSKETPNSLIETQDKIFIVRVLSEHFSKPDSLTAQDDGIPMENINIPELIERVKNNDCLGTYSYNVHQINGDLTKVAASRELKRPDNF